MTGRSCSMPYSGRPTQQLKLGSPLCILMNSRVTTSTAALRLSARATYCSRTISKSVISFLYCLAIMQLDIHWLGMQSYKRTVISCRIRLSYVQSRGYKWICIDVQIVHKIPILYGELLDSLLPGINGRRWRAALYYSDLTVVRMSEMPLFIAGPPQCGGQLW